MKVKRSLQCGSVVFEVSSRDVTLLAVSGISARSAAIGTANENEFEQLDERATRHSSLLDEILARPVARRDTRNPKSSEPASHE